MFLDLDNILYFAYMEEQEKRQREQIEFTLKKYEISKPNKPPQNEKDNEKNFFPEI